MEKTVFFGRNLEILMAIYDLERKDLATYLDVTTQAVGRWLEKNIVPETETLISLCAKFKMEMGDLLYTDLENISLRAIELSSVADGIAAEGSDVQYAINAHLHSMKKHLTVMQEENNRAIQQFS